jgi:hypothetical protein
MHGHLNVKVHLGAHLNVKTLNGLKNFGRIPFPTLYDFTLCNC